MSFFPKYLLIATGVFSLVLLTPNVSAQQTSIPEDALSVDVFNLFKNAVQYVQIANISDEQEVAIGRQINEKLLSQQYELAQDPQLQNYVDTIGKELLASSDTREIPYTFQVVNSEQVNAFATPGGFVYVTTGLIEAADNQEQLASVIAHEIAHIEEKHGVKNLKQAALAQGIAETAGVSTNTLAQIGYKLAVDLPQSRDYEYEADRIGLEILQNAGYSPMAFVAFLEKLQEGNQPEFLRTHPTNANRIEAIAREMEAQTTLNKENESNP